MFYTGRRIDGETAHAWGLADVLTDQESLRDEALKLAAEIAENAPLAVMSVRATMRAGLAAAVKAQTDHEFIEQHRLQQTEDHKEGVRAVAERRPGNFQGRYGNARAGTLKRSDVVPARCECARVRSRRA